MDPRAPRDVVVLDDISRFAGHVWQYLAQNIGFGVGRMADDGTGEPGQPTFKEDEPLPVPSDEARVTWVNAGTKEWKSNFSKVLGKVGGSATVLVDVRGPVRSGANDYRWEDAVEVAGERRIFLVSSYLTGTRRSKSEREFRIRPKTWKTLQEVAELLPRAKPLQGEALLSGIQILVTGAGFELAENLGGAQGLGTPWTADIIRKGWGRSDDYQGDCEENGYPIPKKLYEELSRYFKPAEAASRLEPLRAAARTPDLDVYWNEALGLILDLAARENATLKPRERKIASSRVEHNVREAFRQAFLNYDWGYLNQTMDAAALSWTAWLSTNYTGFADRALTLKQRYRDQRDERHWAIVSTSNEAVHLEREILHGGKLDTVLFKLHGHVEHLLTMAVAGQDKELYSTLSLPVDSLHEVYTAAELYLLRKLADDESPVVWHVVGHGLQDELLVDTIERVCKSRARRLHKFLFVNPDSSGLDRLKTQINGAEYVPIQLMASQYMARLRRSGLERCDLRDLPAWAERLAG